MSKRFDIETSPWPASAHSGTATPGNPTGTPHKTTHRIPRLHRHRSWPRLVLALLESRLVDCLLRGSSLLYRGLDSNTGNGIPTSHTPMTGVPK